MNKYKFYIIFILIFILVVIPINYTYCADEYDFLSNPPTNNQTITKKQFEYSCKYIDNHKKNFQLDTKYINAEKYLEAYTKNTEFNFLLTPSAENSSVDEKEYNKAKEFLDVENKIKARKSISDNMIKVKALNASQYINKYEKEQAKKKAEEEARKKAEEEARKKDEEEKKETYKTNISTDITDGNFIKQFSLDDKNNNNGPIEPILSLIQYVTGIVLGIIQVFSGFLMVVTIAYTGFKMVLSADADNNGGLAANLGFDDLGNSSPAGKKRLQEFMQHLMIGTVITFTSTTIARAIFNILTKF